MQKDPIICPACGAKHVPEKLLKSRKTAEPAKPVKAPEKPSSDEEGSVLLDDDAILDGDEDIDLPDDEDDDDLSGVVSAPAKEEDL
ncbi:MAG: hypothetical protein ACJAYR_002046 [Sneathiella sp.]|jgi:hypothetical protein